MRTLLLLLFLSLSQFVQAQTTQKLELIDVFNLEFVSDPQISPDGRQVIYVRNFKDIMTDKNLSNLWIINFDGTQNRPLTTGNQRDVQPRWSNDGKKIIYKSNKDGSTQLYLRWLDSQTETKLTNTPQSPNSFAWSPDDQFIAFDMFVPQSTPSFIKLPAKPQGAVWNDPPRVIEGFRYRADGRGYLPQGYTQLFILSVQGGTPRQLTSQEINHGAPVWSKDGKSLFFSANMHENRDLEARNTEIYRLSIKDAKVAALTNRQGPDFSPQISPNGKQIAYLGFDEKYLGYQPNQLYVMNIDGTNIRWISQNLDRSVSNIQWSSDSKAIFFQYTDQGDIKIAQMDLNGKSRKLSQEVGGLSLGRPYTSGTFTVANNGRYAYTLGGTEHPADLGLGENGNVRRITDLNADLFAYKQIGKVEEIRYKSSYDQREIQGWIVFPPNFDPAKKYPLILEIHGGPFSSYGSVFSAELQLYAAAGYVVLYTNPRGSTSYGQEFGNLIHHNYPNQDYDDLMSGVDALIDKGYIDENNLFVTGGSGGGVLSAWIVGKTNRFKAAVVAKPVINWYSFVLYSDNISFFYKYWFPGKPWDHVEHYMKRSPISLVANVKTPTMLLTGEADFRTPIAETEQYYAALKLQGVETAMVRIPGAPHGIASRPSNLIAKVAAILAWFEKYQDNKQ